MRYEIFTMSDALHVPSEIQRTLQGRYGETAIKSSRIDVKESRMSFVQECKTQIPVAGLYLPRDRSVEIRSGCQRVVIVPKVLIYGHVSDFVEGDHGYKNLENILRIGEIEKIPQCYTIFRIA